MTKRKARAVRGVVLICAAVGLAQCEQDRPGPPVADAPAPEPGAAQVALNRADILAALAQAGSRHAGGETGAAGPVIAGRTFEVKLPFGCGGPDASPGAAAGLAHWAWSTDRSSIRLSLTPEDLTRSPVVLPAGQAPSWDRVDAYWIARPWLVGDACPRRDTPPPAAAAAAPAEGPVVDVRPMPFAPSPQTAGLVVTHGPEASRLGRGPDQAYSFSVRATGEQAVQPPAAGYRLVLSGRIAAFPDGQAVRCKSESIDSRPVCVAAVELDSVAFEDAAGARLSEWRSD